jgi:glycosyltransferase involved in cell wall biosynthesis
MRLLIFTSNPNCDRGSFKDRIGSYLDILRAGGIEPTIIVLDKSSLRRIRQYRLADNYNAVFIHKKCLNWLDALSFNPQRARVIFNYDAAIMFNSKGQPTITHQVRFKRSLRKADKVLVGNAYLAEQAAKYHKNIAILPLGLETQGYCSANSKLNDGKIRLVWVGRPVTLPYIKPLKNVFRNLAKKYPNLVLRIVCEEFIDINGVKIEKIKWTPEVRFNALAEADIGLAPLPENPFTRGKCSFKVLEYSASGIPVVASPVGTNSDHVKQGSTGFLAETDDQWFEKISELIENEPLRIEMGKKGRQFAKQHDSTIVGEKLVRFFNDLIQ